MFRSALVRLSSVARKAVATGTAAGASNVSQIEYVLKNQLNRAAYSGFAHQTLFLQKEVSTATDTALVEEYEHATGLEKEEIEGQLQGKPRFETTPPSGPFGTKEAPAIIEAQFDERIVGCSGGFGDEEHDVVWFKLKKDSNHECPVCSQVFQLKVIGEGGLPGHHH